MINDKTIMIIIGAISILGYIILLFLRNNREKQKSDVLVTGLVANKLTLEMVQTFLEDPKNIGEEETEMVRKAVNMTLERDNQMLEMTLMELSERASHGLIQSLIPKKGDEDEQ